MLCRAHVEAYSDEAWAEALVGEEPYTLVEGLGFEVQGDSERGHRASGNRMGEDDAGHENGHTARSQEHTYMVPHTYARGSHDQDASLDACEVVWV